jgi:hypothetical protein
MLRSVNDLKGFEIVATDGEIGDRACRRSQTPLSLAKGID